MKQGLFSFRKISRLGIALLLCLLLALVGCGSADTQDVPPEPSSIDYITLQVNYEILQTTYTALQKDYNSLWTDYIAMQFGQNALLMERDNLLAENGAIGTLEAQNEALLIGLKALQDINSGIAPEYEAEIAILTAELTRLGELYPPNDFSTKAKLEAWAEANIQAETDDVAGLFKSALVVQFKGVAEGYAIGFDVDRGNITWCNAFAGGKFYGWLPEGEVVDEEVVVVIYQYGEIFKR